MSQTEPESGGLSAAMLHYWTTLNQPGLASVWHGLGASQWVDRFFRALFVEVASDALEEGDKVDPPGNGSGIDEAEYLPASHLAATSLDLPVDAPTYAVANYVLHFVADADAEAPSEEVDDARIGALLILAQIAFAKSGAESNGTTMDSLLEVVFAELENSEAPEAVNLAALHDACRLIVRATVPIWTLPSAYEEYLWVVGDNDGLIRIADYVLNGFRDVRLGLLNDSVDKAAWNLSVFKLTAALHPVLIGPVTRILVNYRSTEPSLRQELFTRFRVGTCRQLSSHAVEADECWANLAASSVSIAKDEGTYKMKLRQGLLLRAARDGPLRARMTLRDLYSHRLAMPRFWFQELDNLLREPVEFSLPQEEGPEGDLPPSLINHFLHEMAHGWRTNWSGYPEETQVPGPVLRTIVPRLEATATTMSMALGVFMDQDTGAGGHAAMLHQDANSVADVVSEMRLADSLVADAVAGLALLTIEGKEVVPHQSLGELSALLHEALWMATAASSRVRDTPHPILHAEVGGTLFLLANAFQGVNALRPSYECLRLAVVRFERATELGQEYSGDLVIALRALEKVCRLLNRNEEADVISERARTLRS